MSPTRTLDTVLNTGLDKVYTAAAVVVRHEEHEVYARAVGHVNPEATDIAATLDTCFDLASLTKVFVTTAFLRLLSEHGDVDLDTPVCAVLPEFRGARPIRPYEDPLQPGQMVTVSEETGEVDASTVTFRHLLTHTAGLPAWRPLYRLPRERIRGEVLYTFFAYRPGTRVVYSDLGYILLGWAVEALSGVSLPKALHDLVLAPLGLLHVHYRPVGQEPPVPVEQVAATEKYAWREARMWGEVHDENAWAMGGISGHAGLFGPARDVAALGQAWLDALEGRDPLGITRDLAQTAVSLQAEDGDVRRGLGWALWSPLETSPSHPLGTRAFGHTGFTGTSLYVDPERALVIAALTNRVYFGRDAEGIIAWRLALHRGVAREA